MNNTIPGWDFESDTCLTNQRKPTGCVIFLCQSKILSLLKLFLDYYSLFGQFNRLDQELVELLWQNGQVVIHSQANRRLLGNSSSMRQVQKTAQSTLRASEPYENSNNLDQEEPASWIQYPLDDPLEQEFCSNLLSELPPPCEVESYHKPIRQLEEEKFANIFSPSSQPLPSNMKSSCVQGLQENPMPASGFHVADSSQKINDFGASRKVLNFPHFSAPRNVSSTSQKTTARLSQSEAREHSVVTVGSSHCGSNHIPQDQDVNRVSSSGVWATTNNATLSSEPEAVDCIQRPIPRSERGKSEMIEPTVTSSSGGSGSNGIGRTCSLSTRDHGQKRKGTEEEEALEEQSEVIFFLFLFPYLPSSCKLAFLPDFI